MTAAKTTKVYQVRHNARIGRVCPVVAQQCLLNHGCALFDVAVTDQRTADDRLRATGCPKRGATLYADELKDRRFNTQEHPDESRHAAANAARSQLSRAIRKRDQLPMFEKEPTVADVAVAEGG